MGSCTYNSAALEGAEVGLFWYATQSHSGSFDWMCEQKDQRIDDRFSVRLMHFVSHTRLAGLAGSGWAGGRVTVITFGRGTPDLANHSNLTCSMPQTLASRYARLD